MTESASILRYLAQKYDQLNPYYSDFSLEEQQKIDALLDFSGTVFRPAWGNMMVLRMLSTMNKTELSAKDLLTIKDALHSKIPQVLSTLDSMLT